jgi:hypothetical protein
MRTIKLDDINSLIKHLPVQAKEPARHTLNAFEGLINNYLASLELVYLRSKQHDVFVDNPPKSEDVESPNSAKEQQLVGETNKQMDAIAFLKLAEDHYWGMFEKNREIVLAHIRSLVGLAQQHH